MTPAQRAALDALPPKRRAFVIAYVGESAGNATEAARVAKYAKPHPEGSRLLRIATVAAAVAAFRVPAETRAYRGIEELRAWWSEMMGAAIEPKDRIKASELLGKSQGAFVERREVSGPAGGPVGLTIVATREEVERAARGDGGTSG
jgi:phage terminase small subunit